MILDIAVGSVYLPLTDNQPFQKKIRNQLMNSNRVKSTRFHHGFTPNSVVPYQWGGEEYTIYIDSLGLIHLPPSQRTSASFAQVLGTETEDQQPTTTLLLGDSFTEGLGVPYEKTFAGRLANHLASKGGTILNAGVTSYSPILYYYKTKYLLQEKHISFDSAMIFIDLSDIYNEVYYYQDFTPDLSVEYESLKKSYTPSTSEKVLGFFTDHSITTNLMYSSSKWYGKNKPIYDDEKRIPQWTHNQQYYEEFGELGLELAAQNMQHLMSYFDNTMWRI